MGGVKLPQLGNRLERPLLHALYTSLTWGPDVSESLRPPLPVGHIRNFIESRFQAAAESMIDGLYEALRIR